MQAEVHDDFGIRTSKQPLVPPDHKLKHRGGSAAYSAVTAPSGGSPRFNQSGQFTSPLCVLGDEKCHKKHSCPKFKEFSVLERLAKVKERGLCFRLFGRHWANKCRCTKQCGVNGCIRLHHELLHRTIEVFLLLWNHLFNTVSQNLWWKVYMWCKLHLISLLQVVPVTLYGPCGQLNAHALLDPGSTCSLIRGDVADQLHLDGPPTSLDLFGIHLKTKRVSFNIGPVDKDSTRYLVENALVAEKLNVPPTSVNIANVQSQWKNLADIELQDVDRAEIKVILGSDVTEIIIPREVREGPNVSPFGIKTKLGWTVTGILPRYSRDLESVCFIHVASPEEELNELVKTWWKMS